VHDYPDVATFNIDAYQILAPGETQDQQGDWTHWPNLGLMGCDAKTHQADPADDGTDGNSNDATPREQMTVDQAKVYCISQAWCADIQHSHRVDGILRRSTHH
jgi:hypothetical protein